MPRQSLQQQQKLQQKLSPQQIQLMRLLELNELEMEERVKQELVDNPALEEGIEQRESDTATDLNVDEEGRPIESAEELSLGDYSNEDEIPDYRLGINNYSPDDRQERAPIGAGSSFHDFLEEQLGMRPLNETDQKIAEYIIGNIDDNGYLQRPLAAISDDLIFQVGLDVSAAKVGEILQIIQDFEPAGVGASNLQECLLLQIERRNGTPSNMLAYRIVNELFEAFSKKHYDKIIKQLDITEEELKAAIHEIGSLTPKPGSAWNNNVDTLGEHITPDFEVYEQDGELTVNLIAGNLPELTISRQYRDMLDDYNSNKQNRTRERRDALLFVKQKLDAAQWFVNAVKQRQKTLLDTMLVIADLQHDFFLSGNESDLRPMVLRDVAEHTGYDISTISRATSSKYVETNFGIYPLKYFFSEGMQNEAGDEVSTREIKHILQTCIDEEDKSTPLSDDKLCELLKEKGYPIARRTIAKYREQLGIPVARLRKMI